MTAIVLATSDGIRVIGGVGAAPELVVAGDATTSCMHAGEPWAVLRDHELWRLGEAPVHVLTFDAPPARCMTSHRGALWIGTAEAHLLRVGDGQVAAVDTFERAPTHDEWHTPWGGPADVWSMAADDDRLYVNVHVGGILVTGDRGETWHDTIDLHHDVHDVKVADGHLWAATGERALAESRDRGETWTYHDDGLHGTYARAVAPTDDGVLVAASSGPFSHDGAVARFDGETFSPCEGLPERFDGNIDARRLVARGKLAVLAGLDGHVYVSDDAGRSWTVAADDVPETRAVVLA